MRLLNVYTFTLDEFFHPNIPPYVVASHRWVRGHEITLQDIKKHTNTEESGYQKVEGFVHHMKAMLPRITWLWIDTCCINQESGPELYEAVNSMFRWYRNSTVCLAYLHDVDGDGKGDASAFAESEWFRRGWTLQELLAPNDVVFLGRSWQVLGHKSSNGYDGQDMHNHKGPLLTKIISHVTNIPETVLQDYTQASKIPNEQKMGWTQGRMTTREEDLSYCLLGIFDVSMSIIYGEGKDKADKRLRKKIASKDRDATRTITTKRYNEPMAPSPDTAAWQKPLKLKCLGCHKHFDSRTALEQHLRDAHLHSPIFNCRPCEKEFNSRTALDQHLHNSPAHAPKYDCHMCDKSFATKAARTQHLSSASAHMEVFPCSRCDRSFNSQTALAQHLESASAHTRSFNCGHCNRVFDSPDARDQHIRDSPNHVPLRMRRPIGLAAGRAMFTT
nr:vegetative incompatibility protein het-e-1 [Quercus suber]